MLQAQGDLTGARAVIERALMIHETVYGSDHPDVATTLNNLGGVLQDLGDLDGAQAVFERALRIFKQFLPEGHPKIRIAQENLHAASKRK